MSVRALYVRGGALIAGGRGFNLYDEIMGDSKEMGKSKRKDAQSPRDPPIGYVAGISLVQSRSHWHESRLATLTVD